MANPNREDLEFQALRNALYHTSRRQYLEGVGRWLNLIVILGGAATLTSLLPIWFTPYPGVIVTLVGSLQLVFNFGGRASAHDILQRRYYDLIAKLAEMGDASEAQCATLWAEVIRISADEPPTFRAVDAIAYNEATDALYGVDRQSSKIRIGWFYSLTRHLLHHNGVTFV